MATITSGTTSRSRYQTLIGRSSAPVRRADFARPPVSLRAVVRADIPGPVPGSAADLGCELRPDVGSLLDARVVQARFEARDHVIGREDSRIVQDLRGNELLGLVIRGGVVVRD